MGLHITRDRPQHTLWIDQRHYIHHILDCYRLSDAHPISIPVDPNVHLRLTSDDHVDNSPLFPYQSAIGSLMFAAIGTSPDIAYALNVATKFLCSTERNSLLCC